MEPTEPARQEGPLQPVVGRERWLECQHVFRQFFGPLLKCNRCGATTMICVAAGESKPIHAPHIYLEDDDVTPNASLSRGGEADFGLKR